MQKQFAQTNRVVRFCPDDSVTCNVTAFTHTSKNWRIYLGSRQTAFMLKYLADFYINLTLKAQNPQFLIPNDSPYAIFWKINVFNPVIPYHDMIYIKKKISTSTKSTNKCSWIRNNYNDNIFMSMLISVQFSSDTVLLCCIFNSAYKMILSEQTVRTIWYSASVISLEKFRAY